MAIMSWDRIITLFILYVAVQTVTANFLQFDFARNARTVDETDANCAKLSAALDAFWDTLPDTTPKRFGAHYQLLSKENLNSELINLYGDIPFSWSTAEGRRNIACALAGVHTLSDFREILPNKGYQIYQNFLLTLHRHPETIKIMRELRTFIDLLKYLKRITGFPVFPLDVYDENMARYFAEIIVQYYGKWIEDKPIEETWQKLVQAIMSDTVEAFCGIMYCSPEGLNLGVDYFRTYADARQAMSDIFTLIDDMGLFNLQ